MKLYRFDEDPWPYSAIVCANDEEQAKQVYFRDVRASDEIDSDESWASELPEEITRDAAIEAMSDATYIDKMLVCGAPCVIGVDASLI